MHPKFGYSNTGLNICTNSFTNFKTKCLVWDKNVDFICLFSNILYTIRYLVFGIGIVLFVISIRIFSIPNSTWYLIFWFSQYQIVFDIWCLVISENQIIFVTHIWSKNVVVTLCLEQPLALRWNGFFICLEILYKIKLCY